MTRNQRFGFLAIAAAIAIVAVVVLASGGSEPDAETAEAPTATPTSSVTRAPSEASPQDTATPTPTATPEPAPLLTGEEPTALTFSEGETVRFRVRSGADEEVHVHGYDITKDVKAGETASFSFKAEITGIFEIEFEQSGTLLAQLKVVP